MQYARRVPQSLHEEHMATLGTLEKLEGFLLRNKPGKPANAADPGVTALLNLLIALAATEVVEHFRFEEEELFPLLAARGEGDIGGLLADEHAVIRPLSQTIAALSRQAREDGFSPAAWAEFHPLGFELIERMMAHIQKEEMALLPLLEDALDEDDDARLALAYAGTR